MYKRNLELFYDQLVIGSDLSALSYAYINKCNLIFFQPSKPYRFNKEENYEDTLNIWNKLAFLLGHASYIPFNDNIFSIKLEEDNILKVITKNDLVIKIKFNNLVISEDKNIEGLPTPKRKTSYDNWVIDYFNNSSGCSHDIDILVSQDSFVQKIYFYRSERDKLNIIKDCVSVSTIEDKYLNFFDYSQAIARIKVIKMMKDAGLKGRLNGFYKGVQVHRPLQVTSDKRLIFPLGKNIYNSLPKNINILYDDYKTILSKEEKIDKRFERIKHLYGIDI